MLNRNAARWSLPGLLALSLAATPATPATELFPASELRPGLIGQVTTALRGPTPEMIDVEILGVLDDGIGPGVDMILGRLLGQAGEWTGVAAGMSGSPVTIDGKLVGALSYSIGAFSKEPICGITPIAAMIALEGYPGGSLPWIGATAPAAMAPIPLALSGGGITRSALESIAGAWQQAGFALPVQAVPAAAGEVEAGAAALRPASRSRRCSSGVTTSSPPPAR